MQCPPIDTDRLTLRAHRIEDFEDMCAMWTDPEVVRFIGGKVFLPRGDLGAAPPLRWIVASPWLRLLGHA